MSETIKQVLRDAIAQREAELEELREKLKEVEDESPNGTRRKRFKKSSGPKAGSIPYLIAESLRESGRPLAAAEIAERLAKKGKEVESRSVAAAISRYLKAGRIFSQNEEGQYLLR